MWSRCKPEFAIFRDGCRAWLQPAIRLDVGGDRIVAPVPPLSRATTIFKGNKFGERQTASAEAKRAVLAKFQSRKPADDPEVQARAAERRAIAEAREARMAERRREREIEAARQATERLAAEAAEAERRKADEVRLAEEARAAALLKLEQKAARDARYAARKARR